MSKDDHTHIKVMRKLSVEKKQCSPRLLVGEIITLSDASLHLGITSSRFKFVSGEREKTNQLVNQPWHQWFNYFPTWSVFLPGVTLI